MQDIVKRFVSDFGVCAFADVKEHLLPCAAMRRLPEQAQSVLLCVFPYRFPDAENRELSYYACVPDYHIAAGTVLSDLAQALQTAYPAYQFACFADNSPIPEVYAAAKAGLGVIGKHGLLIHPQYGSYVFIGEIVTDMPLPATGGTVAYCEDCGACVTACHGACLPDSRKTCVSAITQKKGELSAAEIALIRKNGLVWGCDRCQEVCPHNKAAKIAPHPCFDSFTPCFIENDPDFKKRAYAWRGQAVIRRNIDILKEK